MLNTKSLLICLLLQFGWMAESSARDGSNNDNSSDNEDTESSEESKADEEAKDKTRCKEKTKDLGTRPKASTVHLQR